MTTKNNEADPIDYNLDEYEDLGEDQFADKEENKTNPNK